MPFSAYSVDTEDYYTFLPSDDSTSDLEDASMSPSDVKTNETMASVFESSSYLDPPPLARDVLTPIRSLNSSRAMHKTSRRAEKAVKTLATGVFVLGDEEVIVSPRALELHNTRIMQLQEALDAAGDSVAIKNHIMGDAPFQFVIQHNKVNLSEEIVEFSSASPMPMIERVDGHAPEKKRLGMRRSSSMTQVGKDEEEDELMNPDPLYDDQLDDADEQWVQTNFVGKHATKQVTDAMLCCPCCFVTVCMVCERHATFTNQYRATAAINCRVKRDETLTYTSGEKSNVLASLPFHKRQNLDATKEATTNGARKLQNDEFYAVVCSDCSTLVGAFDKDQHFHFFNVLPSNF
ncbi:Uncharacterized conserved protein [Plasmopara halstedii]|uniref:Uncharacterized conserved protein n=1 Tax=Plasmopara halstedii TaxID=4781 RepID=A0A0P1ACV4_PLAHL|nr:Uncharacterized conserved protein [Plasmopara halstedii]CEG38182.1 Uncharacterized conserved protein [Plasmopara halstedii]|eukprot:XP_024574551.1 Uncharacterized conserved protein [Plasmopara halstedii]